MKQPLVSILIPAYNAEKYLADTIESALGQTWREKEIIVVDDGSTDSTLNIAQAYAQRGVQVLTQENRGASAARNLAYTHALGEYVQYLDADDVINPCKIEVQLSRLKGALPRTVASAAWGRFTDDPATTAFVPGVLWQDMTPVEFLVNAWNGHLMMQPGAWLVPRSVLGDAGRWDERLSVNDDGEYFARVLLAADRIVYCSDAHVHYRSQNPKSLASSSGRAASESLLLSIELCVEHLLTSEDSARTRRAAANLLQHFVYNTYPDHADLVERAARNIDRTASPNAAPTGPPLFEMLRHVVGWRLARRIERTATRLGVNRASLRKRLAGFTASVR